MTRFKITGDVSLNLRYLIYIPFRKGGIGVVEDLVPLFEPVYILCCLCPESLWLIPSSSERLIVKLGVCNWRPVTAVWLRLTVLLLMKDEMLGYFFFAWTYHVFTCTYLQKDICYHFSSVNYLLSDESFP